MKKISHILLYSTLATSLLTACSDSDWFDGGFSGDRQKIELTGDIDQVPVTMQYTNERAAYGHYAEQRKHINTFCVRLNDEMNLTELASTARLLFVTILSARSATAPMPR